MSGTGAPSDGTVGSELSTAVVSMRPLTASAPPVPGVAPFTPHQLPCAFTES